MPSDYLLLVDSNEPESIRKILRKYEVLFTVKKLETADYAFGPVGIERKEIMDFYSSLIDGRLFRPGGQCERLKEEFEIPIIAIIGSLSRLYKKHYKKLGWIISSMRKIVLSHGISIISFPTDDEFARFLLSMVRHPDEINSSSPDFRIRTPDLSITARMLMQIPGIGPKKAKMIADEVGTIDDLLFLMSENREELKKIKGIGDKTWDVIWKAITGD
ncbi:MAG: ERCC4 domain-containing protein [Candidatus Helarchaeales archaeon]